MNGTLFVVMHDEMMKRFVLKKEEQQQNLTGSHPPVLGCSGPIMRSPRARQNKPEPFGIKGFVFPTCST